MFSAIRKEFEEPQRKPTFDYSMHCFRAFAILCIVIGHCLGAHGNFALYESRTFIIFMDSLCGGFFAHGTHFFVFISGFLFYKINRTTPIVELYVKKAKTLVSPYLFVSCVFVFLSYLNYILFSNYLSYVWTPTSFEEAILGIVNGRVQGQFWYMPFIFSIFLVVPFIVRMPSRYFNWVVLVLIILPLIFPRKDFTSFTLESVFNFLSVYMYHGGMFYCGILYAMYKPAILTFCRRNILPLIFLVFLTFIVLAFECHNHWIGSSSAIHYVQKLSAIGLLVVLLEHVRNNAVLDIIARYSFPLYFIHLFVINSLVKTECIKNIWLFFNSPVRMILLIFSVISLTLIVSIILKLILRKYSKFVIGV